jgi:glutamate carboxypeptidase
VLVLGHYDTVWGVGTLEKLRYRVDGARAFGPGIFDMKASLVILEFALRAIRASGQSPPRPIVALITSDEEIGSPDSKTLIEEEARKSAHVLVLEPPLKGGELKTSRNGIAHFQIAVKGQSAHAGSPAEGVNAIHELAYQILEIRNLSNGRTGTTINVGTIQGGTQTNVIPGAAVATVDVRFRHDAELDRIMQAVYALKPADPRAELSREPGFQRSPMMRTPSIVELFRRVHEVGELLGLSLQEGHGTGTSDANLTAALSVPTLDGFGACGDGAHANDEYILIDSLTKRAELLAAVLLKL